MRPEGRTKFLSFINSRPTLLSLLYELDYMPEQVKVGSQDETWMFRIASVFALGELVEREACAKIADTMDVPDCRDACEHEYPNHCVAAAIRARSADPAEGGRP